MQEAVTLRLLPAAAVGSEAMLVEVMEVADAKTDMLRLSRGDASTATVRCRM